MSLSTSVHSDTSTKQSEINEEQIQLIIENAKHGDASNQYLAGILYQRGEQIPQDLQKAAHWYTKAAEQNYAPAQLSMGMLHDVGVGVSQNDELAHDWYKKACLLYTSPSPRDS